MANMFIANQIDSADLRDDCTIDAVDALGNEFDMASYTDLIWMLISC